MWTALLVLALLWAQSLGLWHGTVHGQSIDRAAAHGTPAIHASGAAGKAVAPDWVETLFSGHQKASDCQLFDQLSHADALTHLSLIDLPWALLPTLLRASHGLCVARWHAQFQARGPPSVR